MGLHRLPHDANGVQTDGNQKGPGLGCRQNGVDGEVCHMRACIVV
jgi:hypothetical protein